LDFTLHSMLSSLTGRLRTPVLPFVFHKRLSHTLPAAPPIKALDTPAQTAEAQSWLTAFRTQSIPRSLVELSFSRSSGPGGQNVNKVNTKATLRCLLDRSWIPQWAHTYLTKSPYYVSSTNSLLITSTTHRSQAQNVDECLRKLHECILTASTTPIRNEPSPEQKKRVQDLERMEKARRRAAKTKRSHVKSGRGKSGGAWD